MKTDKNDLGIGPILLLILTAVVLVIAGLIFSVLWGWFVVPLGVPAINVAHGIGLAVLLGFLRIDIKPKPEYGVKTAVLSRILTILLPFAVAFIAHLFI